MEKTSFRKRARFNGRDGTSGGRFQLVSKTLGYRMRVVWGRKKNSGGELEEKGYNGVENNHNKRGRKDRDRGEGAHDERNLKKLIRTRREGDHDNDEKDKKNRSKSSGSIKEPLENS